MRRGPFAPSARARAFALLLVLPGLGPGSLRAQDQAGRLFDSLDAWIAGAYLGAAALAFPFDEPIAVAIQDSVFQETPGLKQVAATFNFMGFPGSLLMSGGMYGAGRLFDSADLADVGLHTAEAILLAEVFTYILKYTAGRARPALDSRDPFNFQLLRGIRDDDYTSFPSGHSSAAFATAAALAHELERVLGGSDVLYGIITYGPASLVALSRMFSNRHWTSDVVFGAAIGAFSGWKVVKYNHDNPDNRLNDWFLAGAVVPGDWSSLRLTMVPASLLGR